MRISRLIRGLFRIRLTEKTPDVLPLIQPRDVVLFGSCGDKSSNVRISLLNTASITVQAHVPGRAGEYGQ